MAAGSMRKCMSVGHLKRHYRTRDRRIALISFIVALCFSQQAASASDWPTFHNDVAHNGWTRASGPMDDMIAWRYNISSPIRSSPVVVGDRLFVGADDGKMYCFDKHNGSLLWTYQTGKVVTQGIIDAATASYGKVFFGAKDHKLYALNGENGTLLWTHGFSNWVDNTPIVENGTVYACSQIIHSTTNWEDVVCAFDESNGTIKWKTDLGCDIRSSPAFHDNVLFIGTGVDHYVSWLGGLIAVDAQNGSILWRYYPGDGRQWTTVKTSPAVANGKVYFGIMNGTLLCVSEGNGTEIWRCTGNYLQSSPTIYEGKVYITSSSGHQPVAISALDMETGRYLWNYSVRDILNNPTIERISSPAIANGILYVGSIDGYFYALNATDGTLIWDYNIKTPMESSPAVSDGLVYIGTLDGFLYCFGPNIPPSAILDIRPNPVYTNFCVTFNGSNSTDPDVNTVSQYYFDFGDGINSGWVGTPVVEHKYARKGNYTVFLKVKDIHNAENTNAAKVTLDVIDRQSPNKQPSARNDHYYWAGLIIVILIVVMVGYYLFRKRPRTMADVPLGGSNPNTEPNDK